MPVTNGFNLLEFATYGMVEYAFVGLVLIVLILLLVVLPIQVSKRKKRAFKPVQSVATATKDHKKKLLYKADTGESVIFSNGNAWYINQVGNTEHYKAVDGPDSILMGKVIYQTKDVRKITITQEKDEIVKRSANERQYITFDFLSSNEVRLGQKVFLTDKEIEHRRQMHEEELLIQAKKQAIADREAEKIQRKADKRLKKLEEKARKQELKAVKKNKKQKDEEID